MTALFPSPYRLQKPPAGSQIDWSHPLAESLRRMWVFNEGGGKLALDIAQGAEAAFISTASWLPDRHTGMSPNFNGSTDQLTSIGQVVGNVSNNLQPWTIILWTIPASISASNHNLISCGDGTVGNAIQIRRETASWAFYRKAVAFQGPASFAGVVANQLYQVVGVFDKNNANIYLYVNGQRAAAVSVTATTSTTQGNNIYLGSDTNTQFYDGIIESCSIYDKPLTGDQILQLYEEPYCMIKGPDSWRRTTAFGTVATSTYQSLLPLLGVG